MPGLSLRSSRLPALIACSMPSFGLGASLSRLGLSAAASAAAPAAGSRKTSRSVPAPPARPPGAPVSRSPIAPAPGTAPDGPDRGSEPAAEPRRWARSARPRAGPPASCPACRRPVSRCSRSRRWCAGSFPPPCARNLPAPTAIGRAEPASRRWSNWRGPGCPRILCAQPAGRDMPATASRPATIAFAFGSLLLSYRQSRNADVSRKGKPGTGNEFRNCSEIRASPCFAAQSVSREKGCPRAGA